MKDDNVYVKMDNGRYRPFGCRYNENYIPDGIWYVRHRKYSYGTTNADHYLEGIFRVGDNPEKIDIPKICAMKDYTDYILESEEFKKMEKEGYFTWIDMVGKIVALVLDLNKKYKKDEDSH